MRAYSSKLVTRVGTPMGPRSAMPTAPSTAVGIAGRERTRGSSSTTTTLLARSSLLMASSFLGRGGGAAVAFAPSGISDLSRSLGPHAYGAELDGALDLGYLEHGLVEARVLLAGEQGERSRDALDGRAQAALAGRRILDPRGHGLQG